jgi:hypothetical protein
VAELRPHVEELRGIGVEPYVIGSGTPEEARTFARHMHTDDGVLPIFVDEELVSYRAAGLKRSFGATLLHPGSWWKGVQSMAKHRQRKTAGDPWQQGGAMFVRPDGEVTWRFTSEFSGHHPAVSELIAEARRAVA